MKTKRTEAIKIKDLQKEYNKIFEGKHIQSTKEFNNWFLDLLGVEKNKKILDVACGSGFLLEAAKKRELDTYGLDLSGSGVKITNKRSKIKAIVGNGECLPFKKDSFDYITCIGSLEHFFDMNNGLKEIRKVLKSDGLACIYLPNSYFIKDILRVAITGNGPTHGQLLERFATIQEWKELLQKNGLSVIKIYKYNGWYSFRFRGIKRVLIYIIGLLIPMNLSYCFSFICKKAPK